MKFFINLHATFTVDANSIEEAEYIWNEEANEAIQSYRQITISKDDGEMF